MKKLHEIRHICQESVNDYEALGDDKFKFELEQGRAELAEEILEILNGEVK